MVRALRDDVRRDRPGAQQDRHRFSVDDLRSFHRRWLHDIYSWAGEYRQVNMGKGGFQFAAAHRIPHLMAEYDRDVLAAHTPCRGMGEERLIHAAVGGGYEPMEGVFRSVLSRSLRAQRA